MQFKPEPCEPVQMAMWMHKACGWSKLSHRKRQRQRQFPHLSLSPEELQPKFETFLSRSQGSPEHSSSRFPADSMWSPRLSLHEACYSFVAYKWRSRGCSLVIKKLIVVCEIIWCLNNELVFSALSAFLRACAIIFLPFRFFMFCVLRLFCISTSIHPY